MAKVTIELDTENSDSVRQVYLMVLQLANLHFPAKKTEEVKQEKVTEEKKEE